MACLCWVLIDTQWALPWAGTMMAAMDDGLEGCLYLFKGMIGVLAIDNMHARFSKEAPCCTEVAIQLLLCTEACSSTVLGAPLPPAATRPHEPPQHQQGGAHNAEAPFD